MASTNILPMPPGGTTIWLQRFDAATEVWKNYISGKATGRSSNVVIRGNVPGSVGTYRMPRRVRTLTDTPRTRHTHCGAAAGYSPNRYRQVGR